MYLARIGIFLQITHIVGDGGDDKSVYSNYLADHRSRYGRVYGDGACRVFPASFGLQGMNTLLFRENSIYMIGLLPICPPSSGCFSSRKMPRQGRRTRLRQREPNQRHRHPRTTRGGKPTTEHESSQEARCIRRLRHRSTVRTSTDVLSGDADSAPKACAFSALRLYYSARRAQSLG